MSVLVAAHTSAGKTVVAQYAIAKAIKNKQRVIYTSPIKALSNQKYRELEEEFKDVGLMTGDVTLNPTATCIVMTTEILRNMLYKGSEVTREMAWVIFDEVHYMRDKDRGVVWEETIILLPNAVKYVFLSATIPNANQFAQWICKIKSQPCNVVSTDYRPVPLQHYIYPSGAEGIYLVVDEKGKFKEENFTKAISHLEGELKISNQMEDKEKEKKSKKSTKENDIKKIISLISKNDLNPVIVFAFSKVDCEKLGIALSKMDFTIKEEKKKIEFIYNSAIKTLSDEDQQLPQIQMMLPLLLVGVGIHHGGLLPIVKESVELLFQEGLLKVLFSTETFSMGINMPAKTVVFTSIEKFDGEVHRYLGGGEYIQMSGRAGRRGLDEKGITIMMVNKKLDNDICRGMLSGISDALYSSFRLSYNMIVNLMRIEGLKPDFIVKQSFRQFQSEDNIPNIISMIISGRESLKEIRIDSEDESKARLVVDLECQISKLRKEIREVAFKIEYINKYLTVGRFVKMDKFGWGIVLNVYEKYIEITNKGLKKGYFNSEELKRNVVTSLNTNLNVKVSKFIIVDVCVYTELSFDDNKRIVKCDFENKNGRLTIVPFVLESIEEISEIKINNIDGNMNLNEEKLIQLKQTYLKIVNMYKEKDMNVISPLTIGLKTNDYEGVKEILDKITVYTTHINEYKSEINTRKNVNFDKAVDLFQQKEKIRVELNKNIDDLAKLKQAVLNEELINRTKVLKHFDFINNETVTPKGQVACLISSGDELIITEMLFNGNLNDIEIEYLPSFLSCFLTEERDSKEEKDVKTPFLKELHLRIKKMAERVVDVLIEKRLEIEREKYINSFKSDMMDVVYAWTTGKKFIEICEMTDSYEGNIIRIIRRLDELIKQVSECAQLIGNFKLKDSLDKASEKIRRGIIFAASLYLSDERKDD